MRRTPISPIARQDGIALPLAVILLTTISVLAAAAIASSDALNLSSNRDRNDKRALAAAEAGLKAATYRINKLAPSNSMCVTSVPVAPVAGECPAYSEGLGNGARYTYYTPFIDDGDQCAGLPVEGGVPGSVTIVQRCITSTGEVNGVSRRVQARVAAYQGLPIFPVGGIVGLDEVEVVNSADVTGAVGSNGLITLGNSSHITGTLEIASSAPEPSIGSSSSTGPIVRRSAAQGPLVLAPVDVGDSGTVNDNVRISNGLANPAVTPYDPSSNATWDAATRELTLGNSSSITLGGGTYNFCKLAATNSATLTVAAGAKVRIFIDSPDRPGSGCAPGTGTLTADNSITFSNPSGDAENFQIYVYGWANGQNVVDFNNSTFLSGALYAPQSKVVFKNSGTVLGALAAKRVQFKNSVDFTWDADLAELRARTVTLHYRTAWRECQHAPTSPADPESGC